MKPSICITDTGCYSLMESALPFDFVEFDRSVETTGNYHSLVCTQHSSYVLLCYLPLTLYTCRRCFEYDCRGVSIMGEVRMLMICSYSVRSMRYAA